jgi:predicted dehydrogenase
MPVRIGLIGAGGWAGHIRETLESLEDVLVVRQTGRDWGSMLDETLDGVAIAIPPHHQPDLIRTFVSRDVAVFAEKPLATHVDAAREIETLCIARGARVLVDHVDLFNPALVAVRENLGRLGPIRSFNATLGRSAKPRADLAPHWEFSPHMVAIMLELLGRPSEVRAQIYGQTSDRQYNVEMQFAYDTVEAVIHGGNAMLQRERHLTVRCAAGEARYDDENEPKAAIHNGTSPIEILSVARTRPLTAALTHFVEMTRSATPVLHHVTLGRQVVELLTQVDQSIAAGRAISCEVK